MALVDIGGCGQSDRIGPMPRSVEPPRSPGTPPESLVPEALSGLDPAATPTPREPRAFPDGGEVQRIDSNVDTPVVRRAWRDVVSTATLAPVKPLGTNSANGIPRSYVPEPSLLD
jgi:hypothetical protein